jgi:ribosomal 30S subunit maturation factor RimM
MVEVMWAFGNGGVQLIDRREGRGRTLVKEIRKKIRRWSVRREAIETYMCSWRAAEADLYIKWEKAPSTIVDNHSYWWTYIVGLRMGHTNISELCTVHNLMDRDPFP